MPIPATTDAIFIELFDTLGPEKTAKKLGLTVRAVYSRRRRLEDRTNVPINGPISRFPIERTQYAHRAELTVSDGVVIVASDAHYWPGEPSVMHKALVAFCKEYKPRAVIFNGDVIDAPQISRHPPIGWETRPKLADEIECAKDRLHEIEKAAFKADKIWCLGNHDARFETRIATVAPEYAKIHGIHLADHFTLWRSAWAAWINNDVVVKHRFKGGIHAPHNNTMWAGKTVVTGHLHSAKVIPFDDYNGTRYGVDSGCIADTDAKAFLNYTEDNPRSWRSAFVLLTFKGGRLMYPELVLKWDSGSVQFRGNIIGV